MENALRPLKEPGLAMLFFSAKGRNGEDVESFRFEDDGVTYGPLLSGGKIGFRQLAPMIAEYADLKVYGL